MDDLCRSRVPNTIYRSGKVRPDLWYRQQPGIDQFLLHKVDNPFTENDYALSRSPIYETSWFRAVDVWRSGRVYQTTCTG